MKEKINEENILKILTEININRYKRNRVENQKEHNRGITLIALVITILFSYDEKIKCSNSKGFLLTTI